MKLLLQHESSRKELAPEPGKCAERRFSYDLEMKTREQNRNNKRTEIQRFDWFIERIQTRVAFGWLSELSGEKTSRPKDRAEQRLRNRTMPSPDSGFLWQENEETMF